MSFLPDTFFVTASFYPASFYPSFAEATPFKIPATHTGVYHYPGTRWYGKTKQGEFMSEAEPKAKGYRPAKNGQL
jgi:hypothetical protein